MKSIRDARQPSAPRVAREHQTSLPRWLKLGAEVAALGAKAGATLQAPPSQAPPSMGEPQMVSSLAEETRYQTPGSIDVSSAREEMRRASEAISHNKTLKAKLDEALANSDVLGQSRQEIVAGYDLLGKTEPLATMTKEIATQIKRPKDPPLPRDDYPKIAFFSRGRYVMSTTTMPQNPPILSPKIEVVLTALAALTGAVVGVIASFELVHWTPAQMTLVGAEAAAFWAFASAVTAHVWRGNPKKQPVAVAGTVTALVAATISLGIGFTWWQLNEAQNASLMALATAIVAVVSALIARGKVTANP